MKRDFGRMRAEAAFSENLKSQQSTTDFGVYLALARRFWPFIPRPARASARAP